MAGTPCWIDHGAADPSPRSASTATLDPQGNPFGLWQAGTRTGVQVIDEPGALSWTEAAVADPAAARDFCTAVFGPRWRYRTCP